MDYPYTRTRLVRSRGVDHSWSTYVIAINQRIESSNRHTTLTFHTPHPDSTRSLINQTNKFSGTSITLMLGHPNIPSPDWIDWGGGVMA